MVKALTRENLTWNAEAGGGRRGHRLKLLLEALRVTGHLTLGLTGVRARVPNLKWRRQCGDTANGQSGVRTTRVGPEEGRDCKHQARSRWLVSFGSRGRE